MSSQRRIGVEKDQDKRAASAWSPDGERARCVCGRGIDPTTDHPPIDPEAARVWGVDGVVPACPACWTTRESERDIRFTTVSACVVAFQDSRQVNGRKPGVEVDADLHPEVDE